jgi:hypothetical protein
MKPKKLVAIAILCLLLPSCTHFSGFANRINTRLTGAADAATPAIANAIEDITPEQEYFIGRAVAANILGTYQLWEGSPELTAYLNLICHAITVNSPKPETFNG